MAALGLAVATGGVAIQKPDGAAGSAASAEGDPKNRASAERKAREQAAIRAAVARGEVLPLPRILSLAQARVPGEVVKVEIEQERWGLKYEVKILTPNGRVREVSLNARTGALIEIEDD
ncbi:PepSY domain-containing protein [Sphingomonas oleivorans]|uniref:PepSY domain-containing protein n=1 Tax=Sphingomonas oleivorans TaxID=1735121 RepID=UPI0013FD13D3|nr:PepSY domain-containing protein [Sphingomonas oleivorans]